MQREPATGNEQPMAPLAAASAEPSPSVFAAARRAASPARPRAAAMHLSVVRPPPAEHPAPRAERRAGALYRQHGPLVYRRCLRLLRDPEAARDATQEVFLKLVRGEGALFDREDLAPWLYRVATNHCLNLRRDARHHAETALDEGMEPAAERQGDGLDALVVRRLLARFDGVTQVIATAILVDEQDQEDVAATLGISRRTMARKLDRFLEVARRHLVATGEACATDRR